MGVKAMFLLWEALDGRSGHEVGRELLAKLYLQATGENLPPIAVTPRGKPYFPGGGWHFSISHTENFAFCVLTTESLVVDQPNPAGDAAAAAAAAQGGMY